MNNPADADWRLLLNDGERARMLQDIAQVALAVGRRLAPARAWDDLDISSGSLLTRKSPVERLGFIAGLLPDLTRAVEQIAQAPLVVPRARPKIAAPPDRARRVGTAALLRAVRDGHAGRWVEESVTALSPDTPENRAMRAFLVRLRRDAAAIRDMAEAAGEAGIAETARACAGRLGGLRERLGGGGEVGEDAAACSAPPTHRMLAHPVYARVAGWMRRYRQSFAFDWGHPLFALPSRETWRLYETWGLFQTLHALLELGYAPEGEDAAAALFGVKEDRLFFRLVKGQESRVTLRGPQGRTVALFYSRTYAARQHSLSRTMQPDVTLEDGGGRTWILDPKFKAYAAPGAEGDDMDQMHAYRDAIIDAQGRKPVQRAWCLYAGGVEGRSRPLIAYGTPAGSVVGALCLRPGDGESAARLCGLLAAWGL